jgi:SAM-dependent methyltransferase
MDTFGAYGRYYDLLYAGKDYPAEARYIQNLINRYNPDARSILDLGCGTGLHAEQFSELGYRVLGVDSSESMLEIANGRVQQAAHEVASRLSFSAGDTRSFQAGCQFDVVTALFHVVSYQVENEDLAQTFATAAKHLVPGGIFLFDLWYGPAVLSDLPAVRIKRFEDVNTRIIRIAEPTMNFNKNLTEVNYEVLVTDLVSGRVEEIHEQHRMRYLFVPELTHGLQSAGLELTHLGEWMSDSKASEKTWNVVVVAQLPEAEENE